MSASGSTVFFSSHTLSEVETLCTQIAIVREGRIVADEPLGALRARAVRQVMVRFEHGATPSADPPSSLVVEDRTGTVWRCRLEGEVGPVLGWLAGQRVEDVSISQPDLEGVFRRFYREESDA
jgi:ABC-2 type transport system ATP-binding protein